MFEYDDRKDRRVSLFNSICRYIQKEVLFAILGVNLIARLRFRQGNLHFENSFTRGQSYKHFTLVIYERKMFIRLATVLTLVCFGRNGGPDSAQ